MFGSASSLDELLVRWMVVDGRSKNIDHNPNVALHWQVTEVGDGAEIWGKATMHTDMETKRRLWTGVFDYDLNAFSPGGPEGSPDIGFMAVKPERALYLAQYGMGGRETWKA